MATSGTFGATKFNQQNVIDSAVRRADHKPEKLSAESQNVARNLLFTTMAEWINAGFPLWTRVYSVAGVTIGSPDVLAPDGTNDVLQANWRTFSPWRGSCMANGSPNTTLFGGQASSDVVVAGPNPTVAVDFTTPTELDTVGVLLGGSATIAPVVNILTSSDGIAYTQAQALPAASYAPGGWVYFDLNPTLLARGAAIQFVQSGSVALKQLQFGLANAQESQLGVLNIDDYYNLPNKQMRGSEPNSLYVTRPLASPVMKIWPVPNDQAFYSGALGLLTRRYIQDPGDFTNDIEVPTRWLEAAIWRLASRLVDELPMEDADNPTMAQIMLARKAAATQRCEQQAARSEALAWAEERTVAPIRLTPDISCYNR